MALEKTMAMLDAVEVLVVDGGLALKDGHLSFSDLKYVPPMIAAVNEMLKDAKPSVEELKNMDKDNLLEVVQKVLEIAEKLGEVLVS